MDMIRILALADTHLGFDYPFRPRIERRRRGDDFFDNFDHILEFAVRGGIDLIIHGGDLFYRSKIPGRLVDMVFTRIHSVADLGIPVYIVPGNHERSAIPYRLFAEHPNIHFFDHPVSYVFAKQGLRLCLAGFPCERNNIRPKFKRLVSQTGWEAHKADLNVLCMHQSVDGAVTGPHQFTFRNHRDVVNIRDIPEKFSAVVTGHMHLQQFIECDLMGKHAPAPVFYLGSVERTSFAENDEDKGFYILDISPGSVKWTVHRLPCRPMVSLDYEGSSRFSEWLKDALEGIDRNAVVQIRVKYSPGKEVRKLPSAEMLRDLVPKTMNISFRYRKKKSPAS